MKNMSLYPLHTQYNKITPPAARAHALNACNAHSFNRVATH